MASIGPFQANLLDDGPNKALWWCTCLHIKGAPGAFASFPALRTIRVRHTTLALSFDRINALLPLLNSRHCSCARRCCDSNQLQSDLQGTQTGYAVLPTQEDAIGPKLLSRDHVLTHCSRVPLSTLGVIPSSVPVYFSSTPPSSASTSSHQPPRTIRSHSPFTPPATNQQVSDSFRHVSLAYLARWCYSLLASTSCWRSISAGIYSSLAVNSHCITPGWYTLVAGSLKPIMSSMAVQRPRYEHSISR